MSSSLSKIFISFVLACASICHAQTVPSQPSWETGPGMAVDHPLIFSGIERYKRNQDGTYRYNNGVPVESTEYGLGAGQITRIDSACQLYILLPGRSPLQPVKLFPDAAHDSIIDANRTIGCATQPRLHPNGRTVFFVYYHDVTTRYNNTGMTHKGSDVYSYDIGPYLDNPNFSGHTFNGQPLAKRLTFKSSNPLEHAMNPSLASASNMNWGADVWEAATPMMTDQGLKLVMSGNREKIANSNSGMSTNFSLFEAPLKSDGNLGRINKFQYYTTTAAISPFTVPGGVMFSYQDHIGDARAWAIQRLSSNGRWSPGIGYGKQSVAAAHLASMCKESPGGQYELITTMYYHSFNNGFGALRSAAAETLGTNVEVYDRFAYRPRAMGEADLLQNTSWFEDHPAWNSSTGEVHGKMTTPACGRPGRIYAAYTPTCASTRFLAVPGQCIYEKASLGNFHSHIVARDGFTDSQSNPVAVTPNNSAVWKTVVRDANKVLSLVFPTAVLRWEEIHEAPLTPDGTSFASASAEPVAKIGTSDVTNTDRKPLECTVVTMADGKPVVDGDIWRDTSYQNQREVGLFGHVPSMLGDSPENLRRGVIGSRCEKPLRHGDVQYMEIALTSEKTEPTRLDASIVRNGSTEYIPVATGTEFEIPLGFVKIDQTPFQGNQDNSFAAFIPSNVPWKFRPIGKDGMGLINFDQWHSLMPNEDRHDCGGCHNHLQGRAVPWEGTRAAQTSYNPVDLVNETPYLKYDTQCRLVEVVSTGPKRPNPKWSDVYPGIQRYCGSCHSTGGAGENAFVVGTSYETWRYLKDTPRRNGEFGRGRQYAIPRMALMSPFWLAARFDGTGYRADNRDNNFYLQHLDLENHISTIHGTLGLCDGNHPDGQAAADFVYNLGRVIDTGFHFDPAFQSILPVEYDRYHPTVASAFENTTTCSGGLKVGHWDESGVIASLQVTGRRANGTQIFSIIRNPGGGLDNGFQVFTEISQLQNLDDTVEIIATDMSGNRQKYSKSLFELQDECVIGGDVRLGRGPGPRPTSTPTPIATNTPTPTPTGTPSGGGGANGGGNGGGGSPENLNLSLNISNSSPKAGEEIRFSVLATLSNPASLVGKNCVVVGSASGSAPGFDLAPGKHMNINPDSYMHATLVQFIGTFTQKSSNQAICTIDVIIPKNAKIKRKLTHQAGALEIGGTIYGITTHKSMTVSKARGNKPTGMQKTLVGLEKDITKLKRQIRSLSRGSSARLVNKRTQLEVKLDAAKSKASGLKAKIAAAKVRGNKTFGIIG